MSNWPGPAEAAPDDCGTCRFYRYRMIDIGAAERARAVGHPVSDGLCKRYPQPTPKHIGDWCGEHQRKAQ